MELRSAHCGIGRIGRRIDRARPDMAEAAGHADAIGPHQLRIVVVFLVGVVAFGVPVLGGRLVEIGIGKQPQADDAGAIAVIGADRQGLPVADRRAARADLDARIFRFILERIGRAVLAALIEPEAEALRVRTRRLFETGLVDKTEPAPARCRGSISAPDAN